jgi:hypothetical protein
MKAIASSNERTSSYCGYNSGGISRLVCGLLMIPWDVTTFSFMVLFI